MDRKIPMRECIGCRQLKPKKDMLRVIKTQENTVEIDVTGKKNGRGAYVCYSETCLETAYKRKGLERTGTVIKNADTGRNLSQAAEGVDGF